jgi:hypothetical protein
MTEHEFNLVPHKRSDMPQIQEVFELYLAGTEDHLGRVFLTKHPNFIAAHVYFADKARSVEFYFESLKNQIRNLIPRSEAGIINIYLVKKVATI